MKMLMVILVYYLVTPINEVLAYFKPKEEKKPKIDLDRVLPSGKKVRDIPTIPIEEYRSLPSRGKSFDYTYRGYYRLDDKEVEEDDIVVLMYHTVTLEKRRMSSEISSPLGLVLETYPSIAINIDMFRVI